MAGAIAIVAVFGGLTGVALESARARQAAADAMLPGVRAAGFGVAATAVAAVGGSVSWLGSSVEDPAMDTS